MRGGRLGDGCDDEGTCEERPGREGMVGTGVMEGMVRCGDIVVALSRGSWCADKKAEVSRGEE